jgi:ABC-type multidrug transport system ATPase subunit
MNAIEIKNLKKYYTKAFSKDETKAVDDISLTVKKGEIYGFLGPNGAGKTTAIRSILGLLRNVKGEITILGEKINPNKDTKYRNKIGYIPGELGLEKELTGLENCEYMASLYDREIDFKYVKEIAGRLMLDLNRPVQELSKGNKQKVGIMTALMSDFEIYILDEPTSGLDPIINNEFYKILIEKQLKTGSSILLCSHILSEVEKYCDRVAIIREGKIIEISDISQLKEKGLKRFELEFETAAGLSEFEVFLKSEFKRSEIINTHNTIIEILTHPSDKRELLHEISERQWDGKYVKDFNINNSSLEEIFMKYYNVKDNGGKNE